MIEDPAILANILLVLFVGLFLVVAWLFARSQTRNSRAAKRRRMAEPTFLDIDGGGWDDEPEPERHGDEGGHPVATPAPEIGSGLLVAGEPEMPPWLKRSRGDQAALHQKYSRMRAGDKR